MRVCRPGSGIGPHGSARQAWSAVAAAALAVAGLAGCVTTGPSAPAATGAAGGSTAVGADSSLQTCGEPVGTVRLQDGMASTSAPAAARPGTNDNTAGIQALLAGLSALGQARSQAPAGGGEGGASLDSLRLLIQQSNCFVIVDRGLVESAADDEKRRTRNSNEVRDDANMGPGQEVAADFVLRSSVISMGTKESRGLNLGMLSKFAGTASVGQTVSEAKVQLVLSDIRSKVQVAAAQGEGSGSNTGLATNLLGRAGKGLGGIGVKSESNTSGTTILLQAFADAYNKMVPAVQNYKAQQVRGGLGTGGTLRVQGSRPEASAGPK